MDDMNAFERQVAGRFQHHAGPIRPVDEAAILAGVTTTVESPRLRFQTMFSATKFVVAGAIVALFGGLLLSGVLTQPGDDGPPAAGASASTTAEDPITSGLVPGVELVTEVAGPGVVRVLGDGERQLGGELDDVAVTPAGDVWVIRSNGAVHRLGKPGSSFQDRHSSFHLRDDGTLWVGNRTLQGDDWVKTEPSPGEKRATGRTQAFCIGEDQHLASDGTCWGWNMQPPRYDESGSAIDIGDLGEYPGWERFFDIGSDGTVWRALVDEGASFAGLASYDGSSWTVHAFDGIDVRNAPRSIAVAPDGAVWVLLDAVGGALVVSWDDDSWTTYGPWQEEVLPEDDIEFPPGGPPWFGGVVEAVDGSLQPIGVLAALGDGSPRASATSSGLGGSTWFVLEQGDAGAGGLYVTTADAVGAAGVQAGTVVSAIAVEGVPGATPGGPGTFSSAGSLAEPRSNHTATLLSDGRVLVVGGEREDGNTASAEVWDPDTASFGLVGSDAQARSHHTATLLPDGRVLIVGGNGAAEALTSAEVWDPETGAFSPAGSLAEARSTHTATLLPDGRVLVVGGGGHASVEVWDPVSTSFSEAGSLVQTGNERHSATLLPDGRVLVAGGHLYASAEVWDPTTDAFTDAGTMQPVLSRPTATLLPDGRVLLIGGGGAQVWDPTTASFDAAGSPVAGTHMWHTATLLPDGRVLVVGGGDGTGPTASEELWDHTTEEFSRAGSLADARKHHTATLLPDGRVIVLGGQGDGRVLASAEVWEPDEK